MHANKRSFLKRSFLFRPLLILLSVLGLGFVPAISTVQAQEIENLGTFKFWTAWKARDSKGVICYISSQPQVALPTNVNRDPIHFLVVNRLGEGTINEVQILLGYPLDPNFEGELSIGNQRFGTLVDKDQQSPSTLWGIPSDERSIVNAMKAGSSMTVKARSQRGTNTTDTYSLSGVTAALEKVSQTCG